jgi:hypothetical protein
MSKYTKISVFCANEKHMVSVSDYPSKLSATKPGEEWAWELMSVMNIEGGGVIRSSDGMILGSFTTTQPDWAQGRTATQHDGFVAVQAAHDAVCSDGFPLSNLTSAEME